MTEAKPIIAISFADGPVGIMQYYGDDEPTDERIQREIDKSVAPSDRRVVSWKRISLEDIPTDRTFRDAWAHTGGKLSVDMEKARTIHKDRLRRARQPILESLDVDYQRADEQGDAVAKAAVAAKKQALRNVTNDQRIAEAKTPEALLAFWPQELKDGA